MNINQQQTAINAYHAFKDSTAHLKQKEKVLEAFKHLGEASDADVHRLTGIGIRQVSARRNELGTLLIKSGTKQDEITEIEVNVYKLNPTPDLFHVKKVTDREKIKKIKEFCDERWLEYDTVYNFKEYILSIINE